MLQKIFSLIIAMTTSTLMVKAQELAVISSEAIGFSIIGTIVQPDHKKNVVLVKESGTGKVQAYRIGYAISEKFRVVMIENQFIIVLIDNQKTKVYQDKFAGGALASKGAPANKVAPDNYSEDGFERKGGKVAMTAMYRDKMVKEDMAKIMMQVTAQPYMKNGQIKGFQLSQIDAGSIFDKGGFHENDVITAINGIQLDSAAGAIKLLNSLKEATSIDVVVERDGAEQDMNLTIN